MALVSGTLILIYKTVVGSEPGLESNRHLRLSWVEHAIFSVNSNCFRQLLLYPLLFNTWRLLGRKLAGFDEASVRRIDASVPT
jgi:hypothetical protein